MNIDIETRGSLSDRSIPSYEMTDWRIDISLLYAKDPMRSLALVYGASPQRFIDEEGCGAFFATVRFPQCGTA